MQLNVIILAECHCVHLAFFSTVEYACCPFARQISPLDD